MKLFDKIFSAKKSADAPINTPRAGWGVSSGVVVNEQTAMEIAAYYRGVMYISTQVAKLPWNYKDRENEIYEDTTLQYLLNVSPNDEMTSMMFRLVAIQRALNQGNFYAEIERNNRGQAIALWPLPSESVIPMRAIDGKLLYQISNGAKDGGNVYLRKEDIFHIRNFHTFDGIVGQGIVAYAKKTLGVAAGGTSMAEGLFANAGLPSGVISAAGVLKDDAYERMKASWQNSHGGKKVGSVAILEEGAKFEPVNFTPEVLQFLESRKFSVVEIARYLGVPPTKLYDIDASTYANAEQSNLEVQTDTIDAWCRNFDAEATMKLVPPRSTNRIELEIRDVTRADTNTRAEYASKMMGVAGMSPNEIRKMEGRAPFKDGDRFFVAANNLKPIDRIDDITDAEIASKLKSVKPDTSAGDPNTSNNAETKLLQAVTDHLLK